MENKPDIQDPLLEQSKEPIVTELSVQNSDSRRSSAHKIEQVYNVPSKEENDLTSRLTKASEVSLPFPFARSWILHLLRRKKDIVSDIFAGTAVAALLVPESFAYAVLAKIPIQFGIYSALFPLLIYSIFGTSRHLAVGPNSLVSLIVGESLFGHESEYNKTPEIALIMTFLVGLIFIVSGLAKLGFLESILSRPMVHGFLSAVAIKIMIDQLLKIYALHSKPVTLLEKFTALFTKVHEGNHAQIALGSGAIIMCTIFHFLKKKYPKNLLVQCYTIWIATAGALAVLIFDLEKHDVELLKTMPSSIPWPSAEFLTKWKPYELLSISGAMVSDVLVVLLAGYVETLAMTKKISTEKQYVVDYNKELFALGLANTVGAFTHSYIPCFGSVSRTLLVTNAGAKSNFAGLATFLTVLACIFFLHPLIKTIPLCVMNAVLAFSVLKIIDLQHAPEYFRYYFTDFLHFCCSLFVTLFIDVNTGLTCSLVISLLHIIKNSVIADVVFHNFERETEIYADKRFLSISNTFATGTKKKLEALNVEIFSQERRKSISRPHSMVRRLTLSDKLTAFDICFCQNVQCLKRAHILVVKVERLLFYANIPNMKQVLDPIRQFMMKRKRQEAEDREDAWLGDTTSDDIVELPGPEVRAIIFDLSKLEYIDHTSVEVLIEMIHSFEKALIMIRFAEARSEIIKKFKAAKLDIQILKESHKEVIQNVYSAIQRLVTL